MSKVFKCFNSTSTLSNFLQKRSTNLPKKIEYSIPIYKYPCPAKIPKEDALTVDVYKDKPLGWERSFHAKYESSKHFIQERYTNKEPNHTKPNTLPKTSIDIKGMDFNAYSYGKSRIQKLPYLASTPLFLIRFVPSSHNLSMIRKSNVAYAFNYTKGYRLNSKSLHEDLVKYNGIYRKRDIFRTVLYPFERAFTRSRTRAFAKRCLYRAICDHVDSKHAFRVSGIFYFAFKEPLVGKSKRTFLKDHINIAVKKLILDSKFQASLSQMVQFQNKALTKAYIRSKSKKNLLVNAESTLGYYPRLPFL